MNSNLKTMLRTMQNYFPWLKQPKDWAYHYGRKLFSIPHESDFRALQLFPDRSEDLYLDVGANHGQSIASIRLFKPQVKLISFEPNTLLAEKLRKIYSNDHNLDVRSYGLAEEQADLTLYTPSYSGFVYDGLASFSRENALNWLRSNTIIGFNQNKVMLKETPCFAEKLDNLNLKPSFIKMDIQGFEYEALKGGEETIASCRPILLIESFNSDPRIGVLLAKHGYEEYGFRNNRLKKGSGNINSFLITRERLKQIDSTLRSAPYIARVSAY